MQQRKWRLPMLPTTTIGSFPQIAGGAQGPSTWRKGEWNQADYEPSSGSEIDRWIELQEEIGLDVLVHGEFERTDMVEFFGEKLAGFAFTAERLGAVLRIPLREAAGHLRRCRFS